MKVLRVIPNPHINRHLMKPGRRQEDACGVWDSNQLPFPQSSSQG